MNLNTTLYQTREAKHTASKDKPEIIKIDFAKSSLPVTALYHQEEIKRVGPNEDYKITPAIENVYSNAEKVAQTDDVTVLILGESVVFKFMLMWLKYQTTCMAGVPGETKRAI